MGSLTTSAVCRSCSSKHCSWLGVGSALLPSCLQAQLSHDAQVRSRASLHSPRTSTCSRVADQTRDTCLMFGVSKPLLLQGHEPRSGFSTTYLFLFVAPRGSLIVWAYLRSGLRKIIPYLCIVAPGRVISCIVYHSPGLHGLKLASCPSHGANLVVTLGLLV